MAVWGIAGLLPRPLEPAARTPTVTGTDTVAVTGSDADEEQVPGPPPSQGAFIASWVRTLTVAAGA